jgi:hypothetical protein
MAGSTSRVKLDSQTTMHSFKSLHVTLLENQGAHHGVFIPTEGSTRVVDQASLA